MWRWRREPVAVGLDARHVSCGGLDRAWETGHLRQALVDALGPQSSRAAVRVLLAPDVCRHWVFHAPEGVQTLAELKASAAARAANLFGGVPGAWDVSADWQRAGPMLCCAAPAAVIAELRQTGDALGRRVSTESALKLALDRLQRRALAVGVLAWWTPGFLALAQCVNGTVVSLRCVRRAPQLTEAELVALAAQQAMAEFAAQASKAAPLHVFKVGEQAPSEAAWSAALAQVSSIEALGEAACAT